MSYSAARTNRKLEDAGIEHCGEILLRTAVDTTGQTTDVYNPQDDFGIFHSPSALAGVGEIETIGLKLERDTDLEDMIVDTPSHVEVRKGLIRGRVKTRFNDDVEGCSAVYLAWMGSTINDAELSLTADAREPAIIERDEKHGEITLTYADNSDSFTSHYEAGYAKILGGLIESGRFRDSKSNDRAVKAQVLNMMPDSLVRRLMIPKHTDHEAREQQKEEELRARGVSYTKVQDLSFTEYVISACNKDISFSEHYIPEFFDFNDEQDALNFVKGAVKRGVFASFERDNQGIVVVMPKLYGEDCEVFKYTRDELITLGSEQLDADDSSTEEVSAREYQAIVDLARARVDAFAIAA